MKGQPAEVGEEQQRHKSAKMRGELRHARTIQNYISTSSLSRTDVSEGCRDGKETDAVPRPHVS